LALSTEIVRTYRSPRVVIRRLLDAGPREDRAIAWLMGACLIIFVGQWPRLQRTATLDPEAPPLDAQIAGALFGWLFVMPLVFYGIAALSHLVARAFGGRGTWWGARVALFWTLLATAPLMLLQGLVAGLIGPGVELQIVGAATALAFLAIWGVSLREAERPEERRAS
jgi:hypothetical protein